MERKSKLIIKRADNTSALSGFRCGIKAMDDFIHNDSYGLSKFIEYGLSNLWIVYEDDKVVAFFSLSKDSLILNSEDIRFIGNNASLSSSLPSRDEDKFWEQEKYPAIEIDYLAVCEEKRNNPDYHIGTLIIEFIAQQALKDSLSATMFLTVEAFDTPSYSAVSFYRKCGFDFSEHGRTKNQNKIRNGETPTTQRMYRLLIPDKQ